MVRCPAPQAGLAHQVLVVEDDDDLREAIVMVLERAGVLVTAAANGREALHLLESFAHLPCVALVDLMMPVMNGSELHAELQSSPVFARLPIVFMSALGDVRPFIPRHVSVPLLAKPLAPTMLIAQVQRSCAGSCAPKPDRAPVGHSFLSR